ncbi:MAG: AraC family transcriptional regulator [Deinococcota bacterium]
MTRTYKKLARARNFIRNCYNQPLNLTAISAEAHLSPYHFQRRYKQTFQETPHAFLTRVRIDKAKTLLSKGSHTVTETCFEVGFSSLGSFSSLFTRYVGLSPSTYQRHARTSILIDHPVRSVFVPSCFFAMLYGDQQDRP